MIQEWSGYEDPSPAQMADEIRRLRKELTKSQRREDILKKGCAHIGKRLSQRYELIDHMRKMTQYSTNEMCDTFDVSRSGYRHFSSDKMTRSKAKRIRLVAEMKSIHKDPKLKVYGSPRMTSELHDRGWTCSENTVATLMQQHGLHDYQK